MGSELFKVLGKYRPKVQGQSPLEPELSLGHSKFIKLKRLPQHILLL